MFFILSKLLGLVFQPVNFIALAMLAGLLLWWAGWVRTGRAILATATVIFVLGCFSPASQLLLRTLEDRFPNPPASMAAPTGIIVLGGAMNEELSLARGEISMNAAATRMTAGVALALRYPSARLVFTGGSADVRQVGRDEAEGAHRLWLSLGIPEARMSFESKSRNTFENAVFTRELVKPKPGEQWLLVTSAWHMPRSVSIFRQADFPVTAYPVDYRSFGDGRDWKPSFNAIESLEKLDTALHEWAGLLAYRITGKTDALFPTP
ncbi:YdcF family protein [Beijerinckia sp. L45]|uniref:YdcF family protein n=1 Tax=Beijerinckia sp. L45 TaxID=1641855 RepID=UPI00131C43BC|nr:YdcF family protein [Beijerinckia sp. L45]